MPPVMGAGAYMMLEIVQPPVTYLEIIRAALLPAILYYSSMLLLVHFTARRMQARIAQRPEQRCRSDNPRWRPRTSEARVGEPGAVGRRSSSAARWSRSSAC